VALADRIIVTPVTFATSNQEDTMSQKTQTAATAQRFDVFVVEDYKDKSGEEKASWLRVGIAFPHKDGKGFNAELRAVPVSGKLVLRLHEATSEEA
jgi:hypothetical protein